MKMKTLIFPLIASIALQAVFLPAAFAAAENQPHGAAPEPTALTSFAEALARPRDSRAEAIPPKTELLPLASLASGGPSASIRMTGIWPKQTFEFVMRRDEIITASELTLYWTPSPALLPIRSQLIIRLNGQVQKVLPISREMLGKQNQSIVPLDPKKLKDANVLELEFIGEYDNVCTTPTSPTLWLTVDNASQLSLSRQKLRVADDLSLFPVPFVDPYDKSMLRVGFAFSSAPSAGELSAATVLATYFGSGFSFLLQSDSSRRTFRRFLYAESAPGISEGLARTQRAGNRHCRRPAFSMGKDARHFRTERCGPHGCCACRRKRQRAPVGITLEHQGSRGSRRPQALRRAEVDRYVARDDFRRTRRISRGAHNARR